MLDPNHLAPDCISTRRYQVSTFEIYLSLAGADGCRDLGALQFWRVQERGGQVKGDYKGSHDDDDDDDTRYGGTTFRNCWW